MKVFISQPMNGKTDDEILQERENAIKEIKSSTPEEVNVTIIDSFFGHGNAIPFDSNRPLYFLGKSLELLSTADAAYFCEGWDSARGCMIEHQCCLSYGIEILED